MNAKKIEKLSLKRGIVINFFMTCLGILAFLTTHLAVLFLDASFVFIEVVSGIIAVIVSKSSPKKTKKFPKGRFKLEPLYVLFKSIWVIILLSLTSWSVSYQAYIYFSTGQGTVIKPLPILVYSIAMVFLGTILFNTYYHSNKLIDQSSELLSIESQNSLIDIIISSGIGVISLLLMFISRTSQWSFLLYTGDFFVTITLVLLCIKQPIIGITQSFHELLDTALIHGSIKQKVEQIVDKEFSDFPTHTHHKVSVFKQGLHLQVDILLPPHIFLRTTKFTNTANKIRTQLTNIFHIVDVNFLIDIN